MLNRRLRPGQWASPGEAGRHIISACGEVRIAIRESVLLSRYAGAEFQYSNGLSLYFPWADVSDHFLTLEFSKRTGWGSFLHDYVQLTRRVPRNSCSSRRAWPPVQSHDSQGTYVSPATYPVDVESHKGSHAFRATPPVDRATPPVDRATPPIDRGKSYFRSMKNPARDWCPPTSQ